MRQSERYRVLKEAGMSKAEITKSFNTKTDMRLFSYNGMIDTTMTHGFYSLPQAFSAMWIYVDGPKQRICQSIRRFNQIRPSTIW